MDNIDKEKTQILGGVKDGVYKDSVELKYSNNDEIENIWIDKYDNNLDINFEHFSSNSGYIDVNNMDYSIGILISKHP